MHRKTTTRTLTLFATMAVTALWLTLSWGNPVTPTFPPITHKTAAAECAACHLAYPAGTLPARSWLRLMDGLSSHFGEDASLTKEETQSITRYLVENAADSPIANPRSRQIAAGIPPQMSPLRFTETAYFRHLHDDIPARIWQRSQIGSRSNCMACHTRADQGSFAEREIRIPKN